MSCLTYDLNDLLLLMSRLRDPETGCPWDLEQTFATIVPYTLEEAYEVADAIEQSDLVHLEEELGDLLFQVIFYAQLGKEEGVFDCASIIDRLVKKLIRRHPHVFPTGQLVDIADPNSTFDVASIKAQWDEIKANERIEVKQHRVLDDVPRPLPAIVRAYKMQKRVAKVGFDWPDPMGAIDKLEEELKELREAVQSGDQAAIQDEMGDVLFAQINIARHLNINPDTALRSTNTKFERRFNYVEDSVRATGCDWSSFDLTELETFWDQAKAMETKK